MRKQNRMEVEKKRSDELILISLENAPPMTKLAVNMKRLEFSRQDLQQVWPFRKGDHWWWPF